VISQLVALVASVSAFRSAAALARTALVIKRSPKVADIAIDMLPLESLNSTQLPVARR